VEFSVAKMVVINEMEKSEKRRRQCLAMWRKKRGASINGGVKSNLENGGNESVAKINHHRCCMQRGVSSLAALAAANGWRNNGGLQRK
jgi:hypothetical protein